MVQRRLFAVGKQALSSVVKHSVATVAWQLAFIPERHKVCSQCKLLLNVIHALRGHRALVEAQKKDSPPALLLVNRIGINFLDRYWLVSTLMSVLFFSVLVNGFFEVPFNFPPSIEQLACTWFIDVSRPRGHLDEGCLLCGKELFHMQKLMMVIFFRWKHYQHFLHPRSIYFPYQSWLESKHFTIYDSWLHSKSNQLLKQTCNEI